MNDPNEFSTISEFIEAVHSADYAFDGRFQFYDRNWIPIETLEQFALAVFQGRRVRRKPKTMTILGYELPLPIQQRPKLGQKYYTLIGHDGVLGVALLNRWDESTVDEARFQHANCFACKEDVQTWFDFQVRLRKGEVKE